MALYAPDASAFKQANDDGVFGAPESRVTSRDIPSEYCAVNAKQREPEGQAVKTWEMVTLVKFKLSERWYASTGESSPRGKI